MSDNPKYSIFPKHVDPKPIPQVVSMPLGDYEKERIKGLSGCAGFFLAVAAFGISIWIGMTQGLDGGTATFIGAVAAALVVTLIHLAIRGSRISEKERENAESTRRSVEASNQSEISRAESEAQSLTYSLTSTYGSASTLARELPQHLTSASDWLRHAETEYKDNAFGPFWDAVENAAQNLAAFDNKTKHAAQLANNYYKSLNDRSHTFPSFPLTTDNLPSPSSVVNELRRIVRMGQTNFQFANIWEHRRTREVMIAGFRTLGEAVNNLGSTVENTMFGLQESISSDVAKLVQEEIKTRDTLDRRMLEQNRMLDNIQQHRKPGPGDRPSRY